MPQIFVYVVRNSSFEKKECGKFVLVLRRKIETVDRLREYEIILDGESFAKIKSGEKIELDIPPGNHELYLKINWCRSNIVNFVKSREPIEFECGNNVPLPPSMVLKGFVGLLYITLWCRRYLGVKKI